VYSGIVVEAARPLLPDGALEDTLKLLVLVTDFMQIWSFST